MSATGWRLLSVVVLAVVAWMLFGGVAEAADKTALALPGMELRLKDAAPQQEVATAVKILVMLTVLSLAPAILIAMTAFTRIIIVLAMLRHAFGMQETPPNTVLISLALFLTLFTMTPVLSQVNEKAFAPYMDGKMSFDKAFDVGLKPIREFMIRQTREQDLQLMLDVAKVEAPESVDDIKTVHLIPAFMLSELKTAFQIGFVIFLPFLLLDLVVASVLMAMGMMMVPPMMISLPLKVLMFVLIDGWNLVAGAVLGSFK
ncbi:MAG TPA: flagellar type III secretion system pore protein FliP [Burkholderiales bacterium]|nr:flagellar type III secretion system pore protein FliP [Burkholderiales bacterium]